MKYADMKDLLEQRDTIAWRGTHESRPESTRRGVNMKDSGAIPDYLTRSYWWAYMWPPAVWFFDHQPIINAILFGQYRTLMKTCLQMLRPGEAGETLQIAAVYGMLTPTLANRLRPGALHLVDILPIQLAGARRKLAAQQRPAHLFRGNAESLPCPDGYFDTVLLFFLLHELPPEARRHVLREAVRTLRPGGTLMVADYGELRHPHLLHRLAPLRRIIERAEPYLSGFWREDLDQLLDGCASAIGRQAVREEHGDVFRGFYRVNRYRLDSRTRP